MEELVLLVLLGNRNRDFAREEMFEAPPRVASGKRAGVADFVTCACNLDGNDEKDFVSSKGREMVIFPECPFSESVKWGDFIAGDKVLRTLKSIRTLITPTSRIRLRQGEDWKSPHHLGVLTYTIMP